MTSLALRLLEAEMPVTLVAFARWQDTNKNVTGVLEEYMHFHNLSMALPDTKLALDQAEYVAMPSDTTVQYHFSTMLAKSVTKETFSALVTICNNMIPELAVRTIVLATQHNPGLQGTKEFVRWMKKNADEVMNLWDNGRKNDD